MISTSLKTSVSWWPSREVLLWASFIGLSALTQLSFKAAGDNLGGLDFGLGFMGEALAHPSVWLAISGYITVFVVWIVILQKTPLARAFLMTALVYVPVTIGAWLWFGEQIGWIRVGGIALIAGGVAMLGVGSGWTSDNTTDEATFMAFANLPGGHD